VLSLVALALAVPAALVPVALAAFALPSEPIGAALLSLGCFGLPWALLGWAYLRLQKPLDEGVPLGEWLGLIRDWCAAGWALLWRILLTTLVVSLPSLIAGVAAGFSGSPPGADLPSWLTKTEAVLTALAGTGWFTLFLWTFPMIAVRQEHSWRVNAEEAWKLTRRTWPWGVLWAAESLSWSLFGPTSGPGVAWHTFLVGAALTLFVTGQVLWLLGRRP